MQIAKWESLAIDEFKTMRLDESIRGGNEERRLGDLQHLEIWEERGKQQKTRKVVGNWESVV